ncbi:ABC transporter permease [Micromonospora sp. BRA006-A]|nr:ABC transporter permease [Micromonospora sp. BRA006-A]
MRIFRFVVRRLLQLIPVLLGVVVLAFLLVRVLPGDPVRSILGQNATEEDAAAARARFGLDQSLWQQFLDYLGGLLTGDFGTSIQSGSSVGSEMALRVGPTLELVVISVSIALVVATVLGIWSAKRPTGPAITASGSSRWSATPYRSSGSAWCWCSSATASSAGSRRPTAGSTRTPA